MANRFCLIFGLFLASLFLWSAAHGETGHGETGQKPLLPPVLFPDIETFQLENGMQVVVIPDQRAAIVTHMVWYRVGAADETAGQSGIAHFLEHLLFKGSKKFPDDAIDRTVKRVGGSHNAFTGHDYTAYFQKVTADHLPLMMELEADRMLNVNFTAADVDVERKVVLEERARGIETSPQAQMDAAINLALYKNHPYRRPIIGWREEIEALSHRDISAFYERFYTPANAVLVVSGNVRVEQVKMLAEKTYGPLQNRAPAYAPERPAEPDNFNIRQVITIRHPQITNESVSITFRIPSFQKATAGEAEALDMLSEILSGTSRSRLYKDMVVERQIATAAGAYTGGDARDETSFTLYGTPKGDASLDTMEEELMRAIEEIAQNGVTNKEVERARNRVFADVIFAQDSAGGLANLLGRTLTIGSNLDDIRSWPERMRALTPDDIQRVAAKFFHRETAVIGLLRRPDEAKTATDQGKRGTAGKDPS